jgi:hypothetical protein
MTIFGHKIIKKTFNLRRMKYMKHLGYDILRNLEILNYMRGQFHNEYSSIICTQIYFILIIMTLLDLVPKCSEKYKCM